MIPHCAEMSSSTDRLRADLIALIEEYQARTGMADSTVSRSAFGHDQHFVKRVRCGENITMAKAARLEVWLRDQLVTANATG